MMMRNYLIFHLCDDFKVRKDSLNSEKKYKSTYHTVCNSIKKNKKKTEIENKKQAHRNI